VRFRSRGTFLACLLLPLTIVAIVFAAGCFSPTGQGHNDNPAPPSQSTLQPQPQPQPPSQLQPQPQPAAQSGVTVYVTRTGEKYHRLGCQYLRKSCIPMSLEDAKARGYGPCSRCRPPL